jgi:hypothetical protein
MVIRLTKNCSLGYAGQLVNVPMGQAAELIKKNLGYEYVSEMDKETKVVNPAAKEDAPKRKRGRPKKCDTDSNLGQQATP